jgi:adenine-specific DNA-methyltransferase
MSQKFEKLKTLLKELFQLDKPDLDFGIYRILHARAAEVSQFLDRDLLPQVQAAFGTYRTADKAEIEKELEKAIAQARDLGFPDPDQAPKAMALRARLQSEAVDVNGLEAEVYDHLYGFFRRYYSEGDFLSKRVYKPGVYAIPYEGEEVKLHWANADQYYIKTSEYLRDYAFRLRPEDDARPMRVHLRLHDAAEGEPGNVKEAEGKERRFVLADTPPSVDNSELVIRFTYRPDPEGRKQKELNEEAEARLLGLNEPAIADWLAALRKPHLRSDGTTSENNRLRVHIDRYTARNTFDYFIHKDLGSFLRRELDFYIKNEVMHLDDIESETAPRVEQYLSKIKVIRQIAGKIIGFLVQLEDFQKKLWLKRKFIYESFYLISLDRIDVSFYPRLANSNQQVDAWSELFAIDGASFGSSESRISLFKSAGHLPIDTRLHDLGLVEEIIASIQNLHSEETGVLIHAENFQAARLLSPALRGKIKAAYFDPPYNTSEETFTYKNLYKHSSWMAMMQDRVRAAAPLLSDDGITLVAIDDEELYHLKLVLDEVYGKEHHIGTVVVQSNPRGRGINSFFATSHDYFLAYANEPSLAAIVDQPLTEEQADAFRHSDEEARYRLLPFRRSGGLSTPDDRPNSEFSMYYSPGESKIVGVGGARKNPYPAAYESDIVFAWDQGGVIELSLADFAARVPSDVVAIMPVDSEGARRVWRWSDREKIIKAAEAGEFVVARTSRGYTVQLKDRIKAGRKPKTIWFDSRYDGSSHGTNLLQDMFGQRRVFGYPKALSATKDALHSVVGDDKEAVVLDLFGGSGTTAHATIELNRHDDGQRMFILAEAESYFDSVLLPRVLKAAHSSSWEAGKAGTPGTSVSVAIKCMRLESYDDTLNNLELRRPAQMRSLMDHAEAQGPNALREQYVLRYMLDVESRGSASLLNTEAFTDPTSYRLTVKRPGSDESREVYVDLIETFNWLVGLAVQNYGAPQNLVAAFKRDGEGRLSLDGRLRPDPDGPFWFRTVTGNTFEGRKTLVIWRKLTGNAEQDNLVLNEWFTRQGYSSKDSEFDLIYVNGDNNLENLKAADDLWKVRLIEEDFHRLMFAEEG